MGKIAFIYPGQGAQYIGMGKDIAETYPSTAGVIYRIASESLGFDIEEMIFRGNEETLVITENTQPALLTTCVALTRPLLERGVTPDVLAGLSIGEYSAHVISQTFSFEDAVRVVRARGKYMQEESPIGKGCMAAILGLDAEVVEEACKQAANGVDESGVVESGAAANGAADTLSCAAANGVAVNSAEKSGAAANGVDESGVGESGVGMVVEPANYNCPGQIVIAGDSSAVERACDICKERGAKRAILLAVSAPFHCSLMKGAAAKLEKDLAKIQLFTMTVPVIANVSAQFIENSSNVIKSLVDQVCSPVRWEQSVRKMIDFGVDTFIEIGPGKTLSGFVRKISKDVTVLNVSDVESLEGVLKHFGKLNFA